MTNQGQRIFRATVVVLQEERPEDESGILADKMVHGSIRTVIYANVLPWGDVVFKATQKKLYSRPRKRGEADSYEASDLWDVIRGAYWAHRWIRKRQRGGWRRLAARIQDW
jgi:hypothetical protein